MANIQIILNTDSLGVNSHINTAVNYMRYAAPDHKWIMYGGSRNGGRSLALGRSLGLVHSYTNMPPKGFDIRILYIILKTNTPYNAEGVGFNAQDIINIQEIIRNHAKKTPITHVWVSTAFAAGGFNLENDVGRSGDNKGFNDALRLALPTWPAGATVVGMPQNAQYRIIDAARTIMPNDPVTPARGRLDPEFSALNMNASNQTLYGGRTVFSTGENPSLHPLDIPPGYNRSLTNPIATDFLGGWGPDWQLLPLVQALCNVIGLTTPPPLFGVTFPLNP